MTKQQIIVSNTPEDYRRSVQDLLNQGWKVIPGTVAVAVSPRAMKEDWARERYVAVLEKYVPDVTEKMI